MPKFLSSGNNVKSIHNTKEAVYIGSHNAIACIGRTRVNWFLILTSKAPNWFSFRYYWGHWGNTIGHHVRGGCVVIPLAVFLIPSNVPKLLKMSLMSLNNHFFLVISKLIYSLKDVVSFILFLKLLPTINTIATIVSEALKVRQFAKSSRVTWLKTIHCGKLKKMW